MKVSQARKFNKVIGFEAVTPWTVGELDEEWTALLEGLYVIETKKAESERQKAEGSRRFEDVLARRRAAHPSYRKY